MSIEINSINKRFGDFVALDDVTLNIPTGQLTALLGPSGGGKSTLLRIIAGLESADDGTVHIEGVEATHLPPQKRNVGFVFQHYAAFKHMSVAKNVAYGLEIRTHGGLRLPWTPRRTSGTHGGLRAPWGSQGRADKERIAKRVEELLDLVHLSQFSHRLPAQLSGGQRQRMALARALAVEPTVLLLDEPFGALDAKVRKELRDWLRRLHDEVQVTTVFVTHDQEEALEVADEIVVINNGRIEQIGSPDQLYDAPANDFVMSFLGPVTTLDGQLMRPHDIDVHTGGEVLGATSGEVVRMLRVGFEVRLTVRPTAAGGTHEDLAAPGEEDDVTVVLTRSHARELGVEMGTKVWLEANRGATVGEARVVTG